MSADLNRITLVGRLTRPPELRHRPTGDPVLSLRLAVSSRSRDHGGEWSDRGNFFDVSLFGARAAALAELLDKGERVGVDGRLSWREWHDDSGKRQERVEVVAQEMFLLGQGPRRDGSAVPESIAA